MCIASSKSIYGIFSKNIMNKFVPGASQPIETSIIPQLRSNLYYIIRMNMNMFNMFLNVPNFQSIDEI